MRTRRLCAGVKMGSRWHVAASAEFPVSSAAGGTEKSTTYSRGPVIRKADRAWGWWCGYAVIVLQDAPPKGVGLIDLGNEGCIQACEELVGRRAEADIPPRRDRNG